MCPTVLRSVCYVMLTRDPHLHKHLGALDVDDEGHRVVHSQAARAVTLGDERGEAAAPGVPHGQVDHQVKVVLLQVVHDAPLLLLVGAVRVVLLERPVHGHHLQFSRQQAISKD